MAEIIVLISSEKYQKTRKIGDPRAHGFKKKYFFDPYIFYNIFIINIV